MKEPGVFVSLAANFVTIVSNESGMETDGPSAHRGHKQCNKKEEAQSGC